MINIEIADLIRANHQMAYDAAIVQTLREQINGGDPWPLIEEVHRINPNVGKTVLFDTLSVKVDKPRIGLTATCAAHVKPEDIAWLWPDRIALVKLTLVAGDPGLGKSMLTAALAAHVTTAGP